MNSKNMDLFNIKTIILLTFIFTVSSTKPNPKVIIIGTGPSGIAAGTKLYENGIKNILWLEAENRIGGRLFTHKFGANVIDYGAQWCDGEKGNVVYEMAYPLGLLEYSNQSDVNLHLLQDFYTPQGQMLPRDECLKVAEILGEAVGDIELLRQSNASVGEFLRSKYEEKVKTDLKDTDPNLVLYVLDWIYRANSAYHAANSLYDVSTQGIVSYSDNEGDSLINWKGRGYKTILDVLMKKLPDPKKALPLDDKILLNKEVNNIIWNSEPDQNMVTVKCSDGSEYKADHVIVTVSLGVLKDQIRTLFTPKLPRKKLNAIDNIQFGTLDKLIFEFAQPWWPKNSTGYNFVWRESEIEEKIREFGDDVFSNTWLLDVTGFFPIENQPNVLLGWIYGQSANHEESLPEEEVKSKVLKLMRMFLGKKFNIPEPVNFTRSKWATNKHFLGSYSYRSVNTEKSKVDDMDLANPLKNSAGKDVVLFAGEATNAHRYGCVHGAIETGWREADRLLKTYT
ncbi:spermine oxidase-like [Chrysoperla carnea]|uniref:spermine oxidase-like n=1 Tax=Chrysoperla carnea TaxID=189513 RepID=UPI001D093712|nr:spermine oxidase-like [Chrysoperla carnea]